MVRKVISKGISTDDSKNWYDIPISAIVFLNIILLNIDMGFQRR